jgi:hypothetical protein
MGFLPEVLGERLINEAVNWGVAVFRGPEQENAARMVFVDAARSALANLDEGAITDESTSEAVARHFSDLVAEPGVALPLFNAAFNRTEPDRRRIIEAIGESGLDVSFFPFDPEEFVCKLAVALGERLYGEVRVHNNPLFEWVVNDKLDDMRERLSRLESSITGLHSVQVQEVPANRVGVRSFMRWAEDMDEKMDALLALENLFDGRGIKKTYCWYSDVYVPLTDFMSENLDRNGPNLLYLNAHTSLAFASGYLLSKSGIDVAPIQRMTVGGERQWRPVLKEDDLRRQKPAQLWDCEPSMLSGNGPDLVVAVSVSRRVTEDVKAFAEDALPRAGRMLDLVVSTGVGRYSVRDGTHAFLLAEDLIERVCNERTTEERAGKVHIFASVPAGLAFFAGRSAHGLGRCVLYEYDFDGMSVGAYEQSLTLPATNG